MSNGAHEHGDFAVRVDFERILETISARIYDSQYAFIRENVQNAIDALRIQALREKKTSHATEFRVEIKVAGNECRIADNGIGMTRAELINNFWTMGASGKNNDEARRAGCIGTFGIGGFANFGVCETLEVTSRSSSDTTAHRTSLSRSAFKTDNTRLPTVRCEETDALPSRGTVVRGVAAAAFDPAGMQKYLQQFVQHVGEAVTFNGTLISQQPFSAGGEKRPLADVETRDEVTFQLFAGTDGSLSAQIVGHTIGGRAVECRGMVRLVHGSLDAYKRGFRLCSTTVTSRIGAAGWIDFDQLRPTAGRDTLDGASINALNRIFHLIEVAAREHILADSELLAAHARLIPDFVRQGLVERLGKLSLELVGGGSTTLEQIRRSRAGEQRVFFTSSGQVTPATEVLAARGHVVVKVSGNRDRRHAETLYLTTYCGAQELDGLIECLEPYQDLDAFERSVLSELELAIRKLFKPSEFRLVPGKLTLDTPIFWSGKTEKDATIVFVDTRHGEFQKLKPLGYSALFWSMIETFCREYLGETLKRQNPKFFGAGAIDLETFSKANSELWELVLGDIEVSLVGVEPEKRSASRGGRTEVVGRDNIVHVTIASGGGVTDSSPATPNKEAAKILHIVDETGTTGLGGYYLRIPQSATAAFGEIIRGFPTFAVVWFANRATWQGTDSTVTAFLMDVTLDRFFQPNGVDPAHGALELKRAQVQEYRGQLYFFVPPELHALIIPRESDDLIKIQLRHELVDLHRPRAWTSKEPKV